MGRPRPVREVMALLGSSPLICMPLDASNAGKNYGTGGDFTANSAPYVGARGASEFLARSASTGTTDPNTTNNLSLVSDGRTITEFSAVYFAKVNTTPLSDRYFISILGGTDVGFYGPNGNFYADINGLSSAYNPLTVGTWGYVFICGNASGKYIYMKSNTVNTYSNTIPLTETLNATLRIAQNAACTVGTVYVNDSYIDFSQEVNRLKFVDGLGYPLDLKKQIEAGVIPKPLIYLPFDDPSNLGLNLGTGGNFTVNGTVTQGADVNG